MCHLGSKPTSAKTSTGLRYRPFLLGWWCGGYVGLLRGLQRTDQALVFDCPAGGEGHWTIPTEATDIESDALLVESSGYGWE